MQKFAVEPPGSQRAAWCSPSVLKVYKMARCYELMERFDAEERTQLVQQQMVLKQTIKD